MRPLNVQIKQTTCVIISVTLSRRQTTFNLQGKQHIHVYPYITHSRSGGGSACLNLTFYAKQYSVKREKQGEVSVFRSKSLWQWRIVPETFRSHGPLPALSHPLRWFKLQWHILYVVKWITLSDSHVNNLQQHTYSRSHQNTLKVSLSLQQDRQHRIKEKKILYYIRYNSVL